jgi:K+-sensing histidine kinase KdpD
MAGRVVARDRVDTRVALDVLAAVKRGDLAARMPTHWTGAAGRVAEELNEIIEANQRLDRELGLMRGRVGRESEVKRPPLAAGGDAWSGTFESISELVENLVQPNADMDRVIRARVSVFVELYKAQHELRRYRDQLQSLVQERTAALKAINRELEAFSTFVSNDLKGPLAALETGARQLAENTDHLDAATRRQVERVRQSSLRLSELLGCIQMLFRITRGDLHRERLNLSRIATEVVADLQAKDPERDVEVSITPDITVDGDARLVRLLLTNLIDNAWKFTRNEERALIVVGKELEGGESRVFVRDSGVGFDMIYAHRLFGAFQRLHSQSEFPGEGIGLAAAQRIVNRHGGRIWAEGADGEGASFYFVL